MYRDIRESYLEVAPSRIGPLYVSRPASEQDPHARDGSDLPIHSILAAWAILLTPVAVVAATLGLCLHF